MRLENEKRRPRNKLDEFCRLYQVPLSAKVDLENQPIDPPPLIASVPFPMYRQPIREDVFKLKIGSAFYAQQAVTDGMDPRLRRAGGMTSSGGPTGGFGVRTWGCQREKKKAKLDETARDLWDRQGRGQGADVCVRYGQCRRSAIKDLGSVLHV